MDLGLTWLSVQAESSAKASMQPAARSLLREAASAAAASVAQPAGALLVSFQAAQCLSVSCTGVHKSLSMHGLGLTIKSSFVESSLQPGACCAKLPLLQLPLWPCLQVQHSTWLQSATCTVPADQATRRV